MFPEADSTFTGKPEGQTEWLNKIFPETGWYKNVPSCFCTLF